MTETSFIQPIAHGIFLCTMANGEELAITVPRGTHKVQGRIVAWRSKSRGAKVWVLVKGELVPVKRTPAGPRNKR